MPSSVLARVGLVYFSLPAKTLLGLQCQTPAAYLYCQAQLQLLAQLKAELALFPINPAHCESLFGT